MDTGGYTGSTPNHYLSGQIFNQRYATDKQFELGKIQAGNQRFGINKNADLQRYGIDANSANAQRNYDLGMHRTNTESDTQKYIANVQAGVADRNRLNSTLLAQLGLEGTKYTADRNVDIAGIRGGADRYIADQSSAASRYGSDRQLQGTMYSQDAETARLNSRLGLANQKLGLGREIMGRISAGDPGTGVAEGASAMGPHISTVGVYSPQQMQAQENSIYAENAAKAASEQTAMRERMGGSGFGGYSPLQETLGQMIDSRYFGQAVDSARQFNLGASQQNAGQILQGQVARENAFGNRQSEAIQRQRNNIQNQSALLSALASVSGSLLGGGI
jgi:hypothetical protein